MLWAFSTANSNYAVPVSWLGACRMPAIVTIGPTVAALPGGGDLTENDKLIYANNVILGKLLESETLIQQAANNTKEQFANSHDLGK